MRAFLYSGLFFIMFLALPVISHAQTATLLWEAQTYTPSFYAGGSLYTEGEMIHAEVSVSDTQYSKEKLSYKWLKNGVVLGSLSGVGRSTLVTNGPKFLGDYVLEVQISDPSGIALTSSASLIETKDPAVRFYEVDPFLGIFYHKTLSAFSGSPIQVIPYFMGLKNADDSRVSYSWKLNDKEVESTVDFPYILSVNNTNEETQITNISVDITNSMHILQVGRGKLKLTLEGSTRNSFFGI